MGWWCGGNVFAAFFGQRLTLGPTTLDLPYPFDLESHPLVFLSEGIVVCLGGGTICLGGGGGGGGGGSGSVTAFKFDCFGSALFFGWTNVPVDWVVAAAAAAAIGRAARDDCRSAGIISPLEIPRWETTPGSVRGSFGSVDGGNRRMASLAWSADVIGSNGDGWNSDAIVGVASLGATWIGKGGDDDKSSFFCRGEGDGTRLSS